MSKKLIMRICPICDKERAFRADVKTCSPKCGGAFALKSRKSETGKGYPVKIHSESEHRERAAWRLLSKALKVGECWEWQGRRSTEPSNRTKLTYGVSTFHGKAWFAHRLAYLIFVGPLIDGLEVLHSCDNMACIRPSHLSQGTHAENMKQRDERKRLAFGERCGTAKLTEAKVVSIREAKGSQRAIAAEFDISRRNVRSIRSGINWKHLLPAADLPKAA